MRPTVLIYGTPSQSSFFEEITRSGWGFVVDNGLARDVVFTMYENFARADALLLFPSAHPAHLLSVIAEAEVGHPLIVQQDPAPGERKIALKPIVFFGGHGDWAPFRSMFKGMESQGLLRAGFDHALAYCHTWPAAQAVIESRLPPRIPLTRIHYYVHTKKQADLSVECREDVRPPSEITIACFGSASTKNPAHLSRTDEVAKLFARSNWNILHGGGTGGVMGQLSRSGTKYKVHITGVTVHASGAPKISFERSDGDKRPDDIDQQIASKDMLHRIETYAGHSHAFVALDGGIGSLQEILVVAELLTKHHPAVEYIGLSGKPVPKPMIVLNESGCYSPLFEYLKARELNEVLGVILEAKSGKELAAILQSHFTCNPPAGSRHAALSFRERYASGPAPCGAPRRALV